MKMPEAVCPQCLKENRLDRVLTAQSNQNVIYTCPECSFEYRNIETDKG